MQWPISPPAGISAKADITGDGNPILLYVGREGNIEVFGGKQPGLIEVDGQPLKLTSGKVKMSTALWNGDKKADLLLGEDDGRVRLFISRCEDGKWTFEKPIVLQDGDQPLNGGRRPFVSVVDWNNDGKKDLVCYSADGQVYWFENKGSDTSPVFKGRQVAQAGFSPIHGGYRSHLTVADWNNDGKPDLLYGVTSDDDNKGYLYVFLAE